MKKIRTAIVMGILTTSAMISMGASIPDGVAKDAEWFAKVDIQQLKQTTIGQKVMDKLNTGEAGNKLAAMSAMLKFDPREDLDSVLLYGNGKGQDGVAVVKGSFDKEQLTTLVKAAKDYSSEDYLSYTIHQWVDPKRGVEGPRSTGCIYDENTLVFADDMASMKKAVDLLDGRGEALKDSRKFPGLDKVGKAPFLFAAANIADMKKVYLQASTFRSAECLVLGIGESQGMVNVSVAVKTPDAETATSLKSIMDGMKALALLNAENNPEAARMAGNASVVQKEDSLTISASTSVEDLLAHIAKMKVQVKRKIRNGVRDGRNSGAAGTSGE